jgi:hypothetical protein
MARRPIALSVLVALGLASSPLAAANLVVVVTDAPGQGFNDNTPATPVGGNAGTTVGDQRLNVFKEAARIWGSLLPSNVDIQISSSFQALDCNANSAVLGSAGATRIFADFQNAPVAGTFYPKALADKLAGFEIDSGTRAITARFNSELGKTGCLAGLFFYLGLDNNHGSNINLLSVVLHEFGHGLGFISFTDSTGTFVGNKPGIFDRFLFDATSGKTWDQMPIDGDRLASETNTGNLQWNGPRGAVYANAFMSKRPRLLVTAPAAAAGAYPIGGADFGPPLSPQNVNGQIVAATDPSDGIGPLTTDGCSAFTNASQVSGKIALIDRGTCNFTVKVKNAQNAGAIGAVIADNVAQGLAGMAGSEATITIPSVRVTLADGAKLRANLPESASLGLDAAQYAGADASGRLLMYAPNPFESGSSVSHWDTAALPNLLMEPDISNDLGSTLDATLAAFQDIGWFLGSTTLPTTWVLPSSAHAPGQNGAFFSTDLTVTNTGAADATFTLKFLGHERDGSAGPGVVQTLAARRTVTYTDVLGSVFGVNAADAQNFGAIRINADTNTLRIVSQTSTPPPSGVGTFGQAVPAQSGDDFVTAAFPRALLGLRQDAAFRTNAVIANATEQAAHVDLALVSESGGPLGSTGIDLQPLEMRQIGAVVTALGAPLGTSDAVLVVSSPTGGARIATYAAVIDQTTNDPRTILGDVLGPSATGVSSTYILPSSAHSGGQNGAFFSTDLTVSNQGTTDAAITFKFLGHDRDGQNGPEAVRTLAAGKSATYKDVLGLLFGVSATDTQNFGAIRISADTKALKIVSQTSTPPPSGVGTFGQAVPALGPSDFVTLFAPRSLVGLRQDSSFRTNAVIANATDQGAHVDLTLRSESGATLGTGGYDLQPYEMRQVTFVVTTLGAPPGTSNASLLVSTSTPGARIATYAALIDQKTNDPRTVLP